MEPLADGVRDPLDLLAGIPVRRARYGSYDVVTLGLACRHDDETCPARGAVAS